MSLERGDTPARYESTEEAAPRRRRQPRRIEIVEADFLIEPFTHLLLIDRREVVPAVSASHADQLVAVIRKVWS